MQHWHLLMTKPQEDERAEQHLLNQSFEIFRPRVRSHRLRRGKQIKVIESLFPRYVFIRLDDEFSDWPALRSTRGVARLVRFNENPAVVPNALIQDLKSRVDDDSILDNTVASQHFFSPGDKVGIRGGSFNGLQAIVKAQTCEERVVLLLNILGRQQPVVMPIDQLSTPA